MSNPRFPHWCRIIRKTTDDPMEDEDDFTSLDSDVEEYDPMGSDTSSSGIDDSDDGDVVAGNVIESCVTTVIYEGACRSYKVNTTSDRGEVITSQRGLSLPLNQDDWDALGVVPKEGDEVIVVHGTSFQEYGRVLDKNVATADFAGTHLIWRYGRN